MTSQLQQVLLLGLLNPAIMMVGYWLGRRTDQTQKVVIAGFIASVAGFALVVVLGWLGVELARLRSPGGVVAVGIVSGMIWAAIGRKVGQIARRQ